MSLDAANLDLSMRSIAILLGMLGLVLLAISVAWAIAFERFWRGAPLIPIRSGGPVPWRGVHVLLCFVIWQVATLLAAGLLKSLRGERDGPDLVGAMTAVGLINLAVLIGLPALLAVWSRAQAIDFGLGRGRMGRDVLLGVIAAIFSLPLVYGVQFMAILVWPPTAHPMQEMIFQERSLGVMALAFVTAVLLAPAAEELLFRGILQGWMEARYGVTSRSKPEGAEFTELAAEPMVAEPEVEPEVRVPSKSADRMALILPAAFFAIVHAGQWPAPLPLFVLAIGLGLLYRRTKSIIAPIAAHATFNGLSTVAMIVLVSVLPDVKPEDVPVTGESAASVSSSAEEPVEPNREADRADELEGVVEESVR